jgi:hypothetical protein
MISVHHSDIVTAFNDHTIGAKVRCRPVFDILLNDAITAHDFTKGVVPGQAVLNLWTDASEFFVKYPAVARACVSSGMGRRTLNPEDYVCRRYREQVHLFLKRSRASSFVHSLRAVVYTINAYLNDPDVQDTEEGIQLADCHTWYNPPTHVLVAVLAGEVDGFVSPYRFVANLAGGNHEYAEGKKSYADLVNLAKDVKAHDDQWATVAD